MGRYVRDSNQKPIFTLFIKDTKDDNWLPRKENMDYLDKALVHAKELVTKLEEYIAKKNKYISKEEILDLLIEAADNNDEIQAEKYWELLVKIKKL